MKRFFPHLLAALLLFILRPCPAGAQRAEEGREAFMTWEEFVEDFFREVADGEDEDYRRPELLERLEELHAAPLNLNTASREELLSLPFLSEEQADSILSYRRRKRLLFSPGELMFVPGLGAEERRRLSLFVVAGDTVKQAVHPARRLADGRHELTTRFDIPLYRRAGNREYSAKEQAEHPGRAYLGGGWANTMRYRYRRGQDAAYGLTLQKDAGEPFGKEGCHPYDYTSFYFYYRLPSRRFALWLGDFDVQIGQGLLWGNRFVAGRVQLVENLPRSGREVRPHTSTEESDFLRGAAGSVVLGRWRLTAFASYRRLDGRLDDGRVASFKTDGLHRTRTELERRHVVGNAVGGAHATFRHDTWTLGAGGYYAYYDKAVWPPVQAYNRYYLRGHAAAGAEADWTWRAGRWGMTGEAATDREGHAALTTTLRYEPAAGVALTLQPRLLSPHFVAPYADVLQEGSRAQNERALLLGALFKLPHSLEARAYVEGFRHPRPVFQAAGPSQGMEGFLELKYAPARSQTVLSFRYKGKSKQQNVTGHAGLLEYVGTHRLRCAAGFGTKTLRGNMAADAVVATRQTARNTFGWMLSARGLCAATPRLSAALFAAVFFTDDYASRLYAYEPQLQYAGGFPSFAYHGMRIVARADWHPSQHVSLSLRYGLLHYFNRNSISSGPQLIESSSKNDLSVQLGIRL